MISSKNDETVVITLNGNEVEVPSGMNAVEELLLGIGLAEKLF